MIEIGNIRNGDHGIRVDTFSGSPLGNPYYREPRAVAVAKYRVWLWDKMQDTGSAQSKELGRLASIYRDQGRLKLLCWCAPKKCHAEVIRSAILWLLDSVASNVKHRDQGHREETGTTMTAIDVKWTPYRNYLIIQCSCGHRFDQRMNQWTVTCVRCGCTERIDKLRNRLVGFKEGVS